MSEAEPSDGAADLDSDARQAAVSALQAAWRERVARVLMMNIGLIDEELSGATAEFLARENWLIAGKPDLEDRHVAVSPGAAEDVARDRLADKGGVLWVVTVLAGRVPAADSYATFVDPDVRSSSRAPHERPARS